ncbi:myosin heavy chain kinase B [Dictyostelium purpureum]|uniref:Myosin heavy chain kinase B n=1 Tax=Dictyostelium purpureum TaxID=5786 RepID=F0ZQI3_DICPU|nr:myosin heavy chain kinase B [Dictyostelium purpureum]EGC33807.1 myosin heavy chain kinase B [Dictyostelium purpureum]|eukprot:XP_003289678.1 myosin heavy chain kinase B [Dictyostelium purpureum]
MVFSVWFSYEDEEVELSDLTNDTSISAIRKLLHEGKIFRFPYGTSQTDLQIGKLISTGTNNSSDNKFEKLKARNTLGDIQYKVGDTLYVRVKKSKPTNESFLPTLNMTFLEGSERAVKWEYDPYATTAQWTCTATLVKVEPVPFAEGAFRKAYHTQDLSKPNESGRYVSKISKKPTARGSYFEDVRMQMIAKKWADKYNALKPPKKIEFLQSCVLEFVDRTSSDLVCGAEPYVEGQYRKYNNNSGFVSNDERNTPQSFSHFTYEHSNRQLLIIDIQGVGDHYTDPQIHTYDGVGFGIGNLGQKGFEKFLDTHKCNAICQYLNLQSINPKSEKSDCGTVPRPDLIFPDTSIERDNNVSTVTKSIVEISTGNGASERELASPIINRSSLLNSSDNNFNNCNNNNNNNNNNNINNNINTPVKERSKSKSSADIEKPLVDHKKKELSLNVDKIKLLESIKGYHVTSHLCICDNLLFTGCSDNSIRVYEYKNETMECIQTLKGHEGPVESICYNEQYLFSGSSDHSIKVWDLKKLRCIFTLEGHDKPVHTVIVNDRYLFSGSSDKTIKVWDLKTLECKHTLESHARAVKTLAVSGQYLFSGSNDKTIKIWDISPSKTTIKNLYTLKGHTKWVTTICILGSTLYSGSYDKTIRVWNLKNLEPIQVLRGHMGWVENMVICEKFLFTASDDNTIKVWDLESLKCVSTIEAHNASIQGLAVWENKKCLISCSHDQTIKLWGWE